MVRSAGNGHRTAIVLTAMVAISLGISALSFVNIEREFEDQRFALIWPVAIQAVGGGQVFALAFWLALRGGTLRRWAVTIVLLLLHGYASAGGVLVAGGSAQQAQLGFVVLVVMLAAFFGACAFLAPFRWFLGWQLVHEPTEPTTIAGQRWKFAIRHPLAWMLVVSVPFGVINVAQPNQDATAAAITTILFAPVIALLVMPAITALVSTHGAGRGLRRSLLILAIISVIEYGVLVVILTIASTSFSGPRFPLWTNLINPTHLLIVGMNGGLYVTSLAASCGFRLAGYRLATVVSIHQPPVDSMPGTAVGATRSAASSGTV